MNERIRQLAIEAGSTHKQNLGVYQFYTDELEKFAELIVRECIDIAYEYDAPKMSGPGMIIGNRIEEHFGVEE
jgi:hypothetical protein